MIKRILQYLLVPMVLIYVSVNIFAAENNSSIFPNKKNEWINDFASLISTDDAKIIESLCKEIYKEELATINICTMESIPKSQKEYSSAVVYGADLLNYWHIGREGINDGILVLISSKDRKVAICTGYLTEHLLPDNDAKRIINKIMVPMFKKNEYGKGIVAGIKEAKKIMIKNKKLMYPEKYKNK